MKSMTVLKALVICGIAAFVFTCSLPEEPFVMSWTQVGAPGAPAFQNDWENTYTTIQLLSYGIDSQGFLHINGAIDDTSPMTTSQAVFTLPEGYRPATMQYIGAIGVSGVSYVPIMVTITTIGNVLVGGGGVSLDKATLGDVTVKLD